MLPSMPILFTRDSQDAFGNKIVPGTSFLHQHSFEKPLVFTEPQASTAVQEPSNFTVKDEKGKGNEQKKDQESEDKANALETALVRSYFRKIQTRFPPHANKVPINKFVQFQSILKSFDPNKETPVDLYKQIEQLFGEEHKDLVEEFLLFLKPGEAAEVGRFMDYFMMIQITRFIEMLQSAFARKPTVLRKILRALTTGVNSGSVEEMRSRVLPHLRSNPRLTQMYKSLFPDERPPDSVYETKADVLNETFLTADKGYDVWEFEYTTDNRRNIVNKEGLDTMYLHGRVFLQHGRMLRPARVTYPYSKEPYRVHWRRLAPNQHQSPPESDEERASPKRQNKNAPKVPPKKSKKQIKSPTKNFKDVNDNTNNCVMNSPKTAKKPANARAKNTKDKNEIKADAQKKERKERTDKSSTCKKDEGNKTKQSKIDTVQTKIVSTNLNNVETKVANVVTTPEVRPNWTRDEDKIMLQVLKGEAGSERVFGIISELLPHRSVTEIKERFCHVMSLLQQMGISEVT